MRIAMLIPAIRKNALYNLRRVVACATYENKTRTKIQRYCDESILPSMTTSISNFIPCRNYCTESEINLPMLVERASAHSLSLLTPLKLLYLSAFKITPYIDKEFDITEFLKGAKYATIMISEALTNKNYESLQGLVTEDMIEILRTKIETLSPNQRQLIAVKEDDVMFHVLSDIEVTTDEEHSIKISTICHYIHNLGEKKKQIMSSGNIGLASMKHLVTNYTFARKYVNNIGGPWIAIFVNHYSMSEKY